MWIMTSYKAKKVSRLRTLKFLKSELNSCCWNNQKTKSWVSFNVDLCCCCLAYSIKTVYKRQIQLMSIFWKFHIWCLNYEIIKFNVLMCHFIYYRLKMYGSWLTQFGSCFWIYVCVNNMSYFYYCHLIT